jgi:hypothetical protein
MREQRITFPELGLIVATRGMLGAGVGLLLADRLRAGKRRTVGWTLVAIGAVSTIPLVLRMIQRTRRSRGAGAVTDS